MKYSTHYYVAAVAVIITIYLLHSYQSISSSDRSIPDSQVGDLLSSLPEDKNAFPIASEDDPLFDDIKDATLTGIEVLGNSYDLKNLCSATEWNPGLWLHCHSYCGANKTSICGGLNNARNRYQTCIRLAIDAGAGLILSSTTERNEQILGLTDHHTVCPEMFWDVDSLIKKLGEPCPQLQLRMCDNRKGITHLVETPVRWYQDTPYSPGTFRQYVEEALSNKSLSLSDLSSSEQAVVNFGDSHIAWNYRAAKELSTIRKDLFKVLNFNAHLLDVSMRILQSPKLNNGSFIGVHLRAEHDWPANYGTAQQQTWHYLRTIEDIQKAGPALKTVYVSCGDSGAIQRFRDSKELQGYEVLDKSGVLKSDPVLLAELNGLNFDEKGIVEYLVLLNAQYFMGVMTSTMSNTIAYARTIQGEGDYFNDFIFPGSNRTDMWRSYPDMPYMAGNSDTRLMVFDGVDLMDGYP